MDRRVYLSLAACLLVVGVGLASPPQASAKHGGKEKFEGRHDNGRHLGWYKHHNEGDNEGDDQDEDRGYGGPPGYYEPSNGSYQGDTWLDRMLNPNSSYVAPRYLRGYRWQQTRHWKHN